MIRSRVDGQLVALSIALVALAATAWRPTAVVERDVFRHLFVFDITQSMNVEDVPAGAGMQSRLEHAKEQALAALAALPCGSQAGVGLFTGHRTFVLFTPVEVCAHYGDISATVRSISWRMAWAARSEVTKGLHSALRTAAALDRRTSIVFLTDGHEAPPLHPEHRPRFRGTPGEVGGAVAGVGGLSPAPIPRFGLDGRQRGFWAAGDVMQVDPFTLGRRTSVSAERLAGVDSADVSARISAGREHLSSLREAHLRELAGGLALRYARLDGAGALAALVTHPELAITQPARTDLRPVMAGLALLLLLLGYGLDRPRRTETPAQRN